MSSIKALPLFNQGKDYCNVAAERKRKWEVKKTKQKQTRHKRERERETAKSPSSCCRMKTKEDETRERNDKTAGVIGIDSSAISVTVPR